MFSAFWGSVVWHVAAPVVRVLRKAIASALFWRRSSPTHERQALGALLYFNSLARAHGVYARTHTFRTLLAFHKEIPCIVERLWLWGYSLEFEGYLAQLQPYLDYTEAAFNVCACAFACRA